MKHKNLYALTLTSAAMLCGTGTVAWAQNHDNGQAPTAHAGTRNQTSNSMRASKLIGATVKNKAGDSIGEISDLLVSPGAGGSISTAVVAVGGVLGVGEKKIAVPYKNFSVSPDGKTLYLDMTADQLKSMPPYTDDEKGDAATRQKTSQNTSNNQFERGTASSTAASNASAAKTPHVLKASEQPASALIGAEVVDRADAKVGKIKDVIVSTSGGRQAQAVLTVGGGIGNIGGHEIAVPLDNLTNQRAGGSAKHEPQRVQANLTVSELEALPEFKYE
jgi:sporulation protein YlmC with PRC-barrel domain